jgi:hypothetical protein
MQNVTIVGIVVHNRKMWLNALSTDSPAVLNGNRPDNNDMTQACTDRTKHQHRNNDKNEKKLASDPRSKTFAKYVINEDSRRTTQFYKCRPALRIHNSNLSISLLNVI